MNNNRKLTDQDQSTLDNLRSEVHHLQAMLGSTGWQVLSTHLEARVEQALAAVVDTEHNQTTLPQQQQMIGEFRAFKYIKDWAGYRVKELQEQIEALKGGE